MYPQQHTDHSLSKFHINCRLWYSPWGCASCMHVFGSPMRVTHIENLGHISLVTMQRAVKSLTENKDMTTDCRGYWSWIQGHWPKTQLRKTIALVSANTPPEGLRLDAQVAIEVCHPDVRCFAHSDNGPGPRVSNSCNIRARATFPQP